MNPSGALSLRALAPKLASVAAALGFSLFVVDCLDTRATTASGSDAGTDGPEGPASVVVDVGTELAAVAPNHYGIHASVYDNALHHADLPAELDEAGITLLRWPGGGYSDNYHWSTHSMTPWPGNPDVEPDHPAADPDYGWLAQNSDFGSFVGLVERTRSSVMITVNYGSNLQGTGPGEPKEAAAWVAYANGSPDDPREIGMDGAGNDWRTVGYWASLRASAPEAEDDGLNHLRIARPEPLGIEYWEVGNEVFGNGFHENNGGNGFELDLHVPYRTRDDDEDDPEFIRFLNPLLSGTTYGAGVRAYAEEMKAVDPTIKVGAVLGTPPDDTWMNRTLPDYYWNDDVLAKCGTVVDFVIVHWYPNPPPRYQRAPGASDEPLENTLTRTANLLAYPRTKMHEMVATVRETIAEFSGDNAENVELVMTEVGPGIDVRFRRSEGVDRSHAMGIFAAHTYLTAAELGFVNVDWLELHNGTFLSEDEDDPRGPAFTGIQMARLLAAPGDRLVEVRSDDASILAHASVREDGRIGVLLVNTRAPEHGARTVNLDLGGTRIARSGERYEYFPLPNETADAGAPTGLPPSAANGTVAGPFPVSGVRNPFTIDVPPHGVTLLLFEPAD